MRNCIQTEKIVLLDGREIECWPAVANEELCCEMDDKEMRKLFEENAFLLFENSKRILSDSRMFLCPIPLKNNFIGMKNRTLGVYIEWWMKFEQTRTARYKDLFVGLLEVLVPAQTVALRCVQTAS